MNFKGILNELRSEKFEWSDPSPIEPSNSGAERGLRARAHAARAARRQGRRHGGGAVRRRRAPLRGLRPASGRRRLRGGGLATDTNEQ